MLSFFDIIFFAFYFDTLIFKNKVKMHTTTFLFFLFCFFFMNFSVHSMGVDDTYNQHLFDENMALIEMPLIAPVSTHYQHHQRHNVYYPYNLTAFQTGPSMDSIVIDTGNGGNSGNGGNMEKQQSRFIQVILIQCHTRKKT